MIVRYLYHGVNSKTDRERGCQLTPRASGNPFLRAIHYGERAFYGGGAVYGTSEVNAVVMHQEDSSEYPSSGVSTTPVLARAIFYATHAGTLPGGTVYKIDASLLDRFGIVAYEVKKFVAKPHVPEDEEVILVSGDLGPLPEEVIVARIPISSNAEPGN